MIDSLDQNNVLENFLIGKQDACTLCERWAGEVIRSPRYGIPTSERADLVQETLRRTWEAVQKPGFEIAHSLRALVRRIAKGNCIDWLRRRRVTVELQDDLLRDFPDHIERMEFKRRIDLLYYALQSVKPFCRQLVQWHFHEQRTYQDIAESTGRNASTLRVHMFNCLKVLRSLMLNADPC